MTLKKIIEADVAVIPDRKLLGRGGITIEDAKLLLPTKSHTLSFSPEKLKYLLIAPPKWGKTTFFCGAEGVLLLAFESGYGFVECPKIVITDWDRDMKERASGWIEDDDGLVYTSATEVLEALEEYCPYKMIVIDTVDMASKLCTDFHLDAGNIKHPSEGGDWGRGWAVYQTDPFRRFYNRLVALGVGVAAITHSNERTDKDKFNRDRFRRETTLPAGIQKFIHSQCDVIMHGFRPRSRKLTKAGIRYISFDGSDEVLAGSRIKKVFIPNNYIVTSPTPEDDTLPWKQWINFFKDNPAAGKAADIEFKKVFKDFEPTTSEELAATAAQNKET